MNKLFLGIVSAMGLFTASEASSLAASVGGGAGTIGPVGCNYCEDHICGGDPGCIELYCRPSGMTSMAIFRPADMDFKVSPNGGCGHFGSIACSLTTGPWDLSNIVMALVGPSTLRVIFHEEVPDLVANGALQITEPLVLDGQTAAELGAQGTIPPQIAALQPDEEGRLRVVDLDIRLGDGGAAPGVPDLAVIAKSTPMSHGTFTDNHGAERSVIAAEARLLAPLDVVTSGGADAGNPAPMAIEYVLYLDGQTPCTFLYGVEGETLHKLASPGTALAPGAMVSLSQSQDGIVAGSEDWPAEMDACWTAFVSQFNTATFDQHFGEAVARQAAAFPWRPLWELAKLIFKPLPAGICSTTICGTCAYTCCPASCRND